MMLFMSSIGTVEIFILLFILVLMFILPIVFAYKYGKQKGRLEEIQKQQADRKPNS